jgi:hypothetical protein
MVVSPYVGGLLSQLTGFSFGKSCTKLINEMALNGSGEIRFFGKIGFLLKTYNQKKLILYYNEPTVSEANLY